MPIGSDLAEAFGSWAESLQGDAVIALTVAATASMTRPVLEDALAHLDLSLEALRPATELGALAVLGDRVQFAHPLCRAAVFQRSSASSAQAARAAVVHAFRRSGQPERAAVHAALSSGNRDDTVATLCTQAAQNASQRSDPETAARYEMLGAQFAQNRQRSAQHLIRAAALWQAAGRPERAMECIRRVTPVTPSEAILGQATYRAARIAFATDASAETPAQMAAGAEACVSEGLDDAVAMLADAAASAMLTDQVDEALQYARRAAELAGTGTRNAGVAARSILDAVANLASAEGVSPEQRDTVVGVMNGVELYTGSPQLAYVLGAAHVQVAAPALVGRWFSWMLASSGTALNRPLPAVVAMVRAKERLDAGDVHEAVSAAENAVSQLEELHDRPLLARALGWCAWAQASAGQVGRVFETATKFFALEPASAHTARLQVLVSLAHCELQRGHVDRATAWLRAVEDESVTRDGYQGCADWPLLSIFLLLCLLADYEPKRMHGDTTAPVSGTAGHWPRMVAWSEAMLQTDPAASLNHLEEIEAGSPRAPMVDAQIKLTSALLQRKLGSTAVAGFNFMQASTEFARCGAEGWQALAAMCLEHAVARGDEARLLPVAATTNGASPLTPAFYDETGDVTIAMVPGQARTPATRRARRPTSGPPPTRSASSGSSRSCATASPPPSRSDTPPRPSRLSPCSSAFRSTPWPSSSGPKPSRASAPADSGTSCGGSSRRAGTSSGATTTSSASKKAWSRTWPASRRRRLTPSARTCPSTRHTIARARPSTSTVASSSLGPLRRLDDRTEGERDPDRACSCSTSCSPTPPRRGTAKKRSHCSRT